uniref:Putative non-ribosomal peptide synthethase n=1 Tax=Sphaerisporangium sp. SANK 60911 TaxID=1354075 RepID=V5YS39_9ACTN|nr:putative non-ribosomal peptide synthethase [Sphaerisporangium sp. SANK 60911]
MFALSKTADPGRLKSAVTRLLARHTTLRTSYLPGRTDVGVVTPASSLDVRAEALELDPERPEALLRLAMEPFSLDAPQRMRAIGLVLPDRSFAAALVVDHLCCDGISATVLASDLFSRYHEDHGVGDKPDISYARFAREQRAELLDGRNATAQKYWEAEYDAWGWGRPRCPLARRPGDGEGRDGGARFTYRLGDDAKNGLDGLAIRHRTTRFIVLAAVMLQQFVDEADLDAAGLSTDYHGRTRPWVQSTAGLFAHSLDLHLSRAEAGSLDTAIPALRDRMAERTAMAVPRSAITSGERPAVADSSGTAEAPLYFTNSPLGLRAPGQSQGWAPSASVLDPRPYMQPPRRRLSIELESPQEGVALNVGMNRRHFDPERVSEFLDQVSGRLSKAAL